jgi:short-subunit dehydrogenase
MRGWAIVTGATGGMGSVFAKELAKRGFNILAVARRTELLDTLARQLKDSGAIVDTLSADLATEDGIAAVVKKIESLDRVELLVNNAGLSTSGRFLEQSTEKEIQSIRVNVEALYRLTRSVLPGMVDRKAGGIINIASVVAFQSVPYWTTYSATKAFVLSFGEGLAHELRNSGVRIVTVCPGFTKTELYADSEAPGIAGRFLPHATPEEVVCSALAAFDKGRMIQVVGSLNWLLSLASAATPRCALNWLMAFMFGPTNNAKEKKQ